MFALKTSIALVALITISGASHAQQPSDDSARVVVDRAFSRWSSTDGPGCAVGASRSGRTVLERGYGMANIETDTPIRASSIFHVASISKQFTALSVLLLARDGKLSIDDDVRRFIPELPQYGHTITIRHLLNHTSGLRDQWDLLSFARGRFEEDRITEPDVMEIVTRQKALNFRPGDEYLYSNTGYTLLGVIVKRASGESLRQFADENIFKPLDMGSTHFHDDYTMVVKGRTAAYAFRDGTWHVSLPNYDTYGATSLFTTVGDLLKWEENFEHPRVGDATLLRDMQRSAVLANADTTGYGAGIQTELFRGAQMIGHSGGDAGYVTYVGRFPQHSFAVTVLCNSRSANPVLLARDVAAVYLGKTLQPEESASVAARAKPSADQLRPLEGVYANVVTGWPTWITLRDSTLVVGRTNGPALIPLGDNRFRITGQSRDLEFQPSGGMLSRGLLWPIRSPIVFKRHLAARPSAAQMREYEGGYYSEELGSTYTITASDTNLTARTRMGTPDVLVPSYGDTFVGGRLLEFTRDGRGKVTGMLMSSTRSRRIRFVKAT
jgi:CubicO group peptidase (beta-lactamase class C family)